MHAVEIVEAHIFQSLTALNGKYDFCQRPETKSEIEQKLHSTTKAKTKRNIIFCYKN